MIRHMLLLAGAAVALPAFAQAPSNASPPSKPTDPNRKICQKVERIGSRLAADTICMTAAEWDAIKKGQREDFERVQRVVNQSPSN